MNIGQRIKTRRLELGLSAEEVASRAEKSRSTILRYENGQIEDIPASAIEPIAKALFTTPAYLMGWTVDITGECEFDFGKIDNILSLPGFELLPLVGTIACGTPTLAEENIEDYVKADKELKANFVLRCKGDSMINARIFDGDYVYIRMQETVENGEIAAVLIGTEATLKRFYKYKNRIELRAENPTFKALEYEGEEMNAIKVLGKAVAFTSTIR